VSRLLASRHKEARVQRYVPDWIGAIISGVLVGLSMFVATRIRPRDRMPTRIVVVAAGMGVGLAFVIRVVLRHFGI
jgi:hypothetical protein